MKLGDKTALPPRRSKARCGGLGPFDDSTGIGHRHEERDRPRFEPGLSVADREMAPGLI